MLTPILYGSRQLMSFFHVQGHLQTTTHQVCCATLTVGCLLLTAPPVHDKTDWHAVVAQLQQMYKELAHLQPAAATRKPGLNKTADIDVEQARSQLVHDTVMQHMCMQTRCEK